MQTLRPLIISFLLLLPFISFSQATITGKVTDAETKMPLQGASVFAQNTTKGVITDNDGNYKLYLNKGSMQFEDITEKSGTAGNKPRSTGVTREDVNNARLLELYVSKA